MKSLVILFVFLTMSVVIYAQVDKIFSIPKENKGHLTMKVNRGEQIEIEEDSAFVVSSESFYAYRYLRNELLKYQAMNDRNLELINESLAKYLSQLMELDNTIKSIDNINDEQLTPIIANLSDVSENLIADVNELKELDTILEEKVLELEQIEKKLKWYRWKSAWFKFADWMVAGAVGFAIGAIAM